MRIDHFLHFVDPALERKLDGILSTLENTRNSLMALFDTLRASVQAETNAVTAMTAVMVGMKAKLDAALAGATSLSASDLLDLQAVVNSIGTETDQIVADTLANTPAAGP